MKRGMDARDTQHRLTHLDALGNARMVDVGAKAESRRIAVATGLIRMSQAALTAIRDGNAPKGDVFAAARIAGIMAAKKTADLIPLCHPLGRAFDDDGLRAAFGRHDAARIRR